jgi:hypothetical protein
MITTRAMPALLSEHQWRVASGTAVKNDFADPLPTPDSPTSTKASSAASLGPGSTPSRRPCNTTCAHDHEALAGFPDQIRDVRRPKLALR